MMLDELFAIQQIHPGEQALETAEVHSFMFAMP